MSVLGGYRTRHVTVEAAQRARQRSRSSAANDAQSFAAHSAKSRQELLATRRHLDDCRQQSSEQRQRQVRKYRSISTGAKRNRLGHQLGGRSSRLDCVALPYRTPCFVRRSLLSRANVCKGWKTDAEVTTLRPLEAASARLSAWTNREQHCSSFPSE